MVAVVGYDGGMATPPARTFTMEQLTSEFGISSRAVRYYVAAGLLPHVRPLGVATRYSEEYWLRLKAIRTLHERHGRMAPIRRALKDAPIERIAELAGVPWPLRANEPHRTAGGPSSGTTTSAMTTSSATTAPDALPGAHPWSRLELLPGLELHLRADAAPLVQRIAREIHDHYGAQQRQPEAADIDTTVRSQSSPR